MTSMLLRTGKVAGGRPRRRKTQVTYLYLIPALSISFVFITVPIFQSIYISLCNYNGINEMHFIGLENYRRLLSDARFYKAMSNTLYFTALNVTIQTVISLPLAVLLNQKLKFQKFFKSLYFMPTVLSVVVIGYTFQFIMNPVFGALNVVLRSAGLDSLALNWLGDPKIALNSMVFVTCWQGVGYMTVLYLGGLQSIPTELYEASAIDGSNALKTFFKITFPLLAPVFSVAIVISTISNVKEFGRIYVMTGGGPAYATDVIVTYLYRNFNSGLMGYGSAVSTILLLILIILTTLQLRLLGMRENT